ncbi:carboxyl transferase domain-containing protein [Microbacterium sp.]|uniref:carboxyl transferase domain-containing protein n=1 Tax=Microbacterium sp. TaxID=51671 RepID=UPI0025D61281|nr:carboxyl transferase domain-containing protein [Microbacterium sp.]
MTGARELIAQVLDDGSFRSWDSAAQTPGADPDYVAALARAGERSGADEAVLTGEGMVDGHRVAVVVGEFGFLGGSIGVAAAERIIAAFDRATEQRIPVLAAPISGGTRMQEGTRAFVQMVSISTAVVRHRAAGLPYLVYLRNPTTGGVFASWGSMGHVTVAEPGALIGFLGPKVYQALYGEPFPEGVQTAENLYRHGLIDAVIDARHLRSLVTTVLGILAPASMIPVSAPRPASAPGEIDDWEIVMRSRARGRPGLRTLLRRASASTIPLSGTGRGEFDPTLWLALASFAGRGAVVLGQDRRAQTRESALGPGALRVASRGVRLAEDLGLPIVTVIDTPGAALSKEAEEGGLAGEIGRTMVALAGARVPVVSVLLGQGAGGGAIALLPADRIIAAENSWLSPLPPEGASAIMHGTTDFAPAIARQQRIASWHLFEDGIVDEVVPEPAEDAEALCDRVAAAIARAVGELASASIDDLTARRGMRFRVR